MKSIVVKARELVLKFYDGDCFELDLKNKAESIAIAKKNALLCVEELIDYSDDYGWYYWHDVSKEISGL